MKVNINIDMNLLRYGIYIGFKLSRLEWLWGSDIDTTKNEFEPSKNELLFQFPNDILIDETSYQTFSQSILGYYYRTDIVTYSSILIGITIQRCMVIWSSKNDSHSDELRKIAKSTLASIPNSIVSDKEALFYIILLNRKKDLFEIIDILENISIIKKEVKANVEKPTLFLSYCKKDETIANIIESQLKYETNNGIEISRYTRVPYKESFKKFMDSIQDHDFVLCIVSDMYLKSQACMYEVGEIVKDHHYNNKLLFIVLEDKDIKYYSSKEDFSSAKIYGSEKNRIEYIKYWKNEYDELKDAIASIDDCEVDFRSRKKQYEIGKIYRNDISEFTTYLSEHNGRSFEELYSNDFCDILKYIFPNWESRLFANCKSISEVLTNAIEKISQLTLTDYNQIALNVRMSSHQTGLVVFADNIAEHKQRYRLVIMEGLMAKVFSTGKPMNIDNVDNEPEYFTAVIETKSELIIPIEFQGNVIGVINSEAEERNHYTDYIIKKLTNIASNLAITLNSLGYVSNMSKDDIPYIHIEFADITM